MLQDLLYGDPCHTPPSSSHPLRTAHPWAHACPISGTLAPPSPAMRVSPTPGMSRALLRVGLQSTRGSAPPVSVSKRACRFPGTRLLSDTPLSWAPCRACESVRLAPPPHGSSLHRSQACSRPLQRYWSLSPTYRRPHVSVSASFLAALASWGIPTTVRIRLTPAHRRRCAREKRHAVTPFLHHRLSLCVGPHLRGCLGGVSGSDGAPPSPYPCHVGPSQ